MGTRAATVTVRVDPVRLRVTGRLGGRLAAVARGLVWSYCCPSGDNFMGFGRVDAHTLRPRPPLAVTDAFGPAAAGWVACRRPRRGVDRGVRAPAAVAGAAAGRPSRPVLRVGGFLYGLAADAGRVWVLSASGDPDRQRNWTTQLRSLDQRSGKVTATISLPELEVATFRGPLGLSPGGGGVWVAGPDAGGLHGGGILLRIDPASGRVAGWGVGGNRGARAPARVAS